ncbi:hypothetical protein MANES_01G232050v8 [Manihot esculenta]|uniref:Uncharacterized protein n=1 Tax=Manihot esculenta TaxID=3983 RepID=A0ACB7IJN8_MANES|nr:hypothetical protein MANES_01G232050v8 [Manihot esculenta]
MKSSTCILSFTWEDFAGVKDSIVKLSPSTFMRPLFSLSSKALTLQLDDLGATAKMISSTFYKDNLEQSQWPIIRQVLAVSWV